MGILDRFFSPNKQAQPGGNSDAQKPVDIRARVSSSKQFFSEGGRTWWEPSSGITVRSDGILRGNKLIRYEYLLEVKVPKIIMVVDPSANTSRSPISMNFEPGEGALSLIWQWPESPKPSQMILCIHNVDSVFSEIQRALKEAKNAGRRISVKCRE